MNDLAEVRALYQAGRYAEAEAGALSIAAAQKRPHDEPFAPMALGVAALAAGALGRSDEALATFDALLPDYDRIFGPDHTMTLKLRTDRAQALNMLGRHNECEAECVEVMHLAARNETPEMPYVVMAALNGQIAALNALGNYQAVEGLTRDFLAAHDRVDQFTLVVRLSLTTSLNAQGRHEEAIAEAERADEIHRSLPAEQRGPEAGAADLATAMALHGLGRDAEARPLAAAVHEASLTAFGPDNNRTIQALALLTRIDGG
ncbi:tetratricopeptide repeat protein [Streptomyces sp. LMG1-1-1.1]